MKNLQYLGKVGKFDLILIGASCGLISAGITLAALGLYFYNAF